MTNLGTRERNQAQNLYLILAGIFIASLVAGNLIFQKFFHWTPLGFGLDEASVTDSIRYGVSGFFGHGESVPEIIYTHGRLCYASDSILDYTFRISVGILPYPITFLVTDIVSEIYGRKRANMLVYAGLIASVFIVGVIMLAQMADATDWSPVDNNTFDTVFGLNAGAVGASMIAYLLAQLIDVQLFHFWKRVTKGKKLWVRNNFSTWLSQFVDTATVLLLLCALGLIPWELYLALLLNGFLFKVLVAAFDTPFFYLSTHFLRRKFKLEVGEELQEI